jgi:hypothetical protein
MNDETKLLFTNIFGYSLLFLLGMGSLGNLFSFIIFSRNKFRRTSFSLYYRVLAICDTFTLIYTINDMQNELFGIDLQNSSYFWCKTTNYWQYSIAPVSGWLLVVISMERMLNIIRPNKYLFMKNKKTQALICCLNFAYNLIFYIPMIVYKDYQEQEAQNDTNSSEIIYKCVDLEEETIVFWLDLFNSTLLPFLMMAICTSITVSRIFKSRSKAIAENKHVNAKSYKLKQRDTKFAVTSVVLNVLFFVFNLPVCVFYLVDNYITLEDVDASLVYSITLICYYLNFTVVFYVNLLSNRFFRQELLVFLRFRKPP